MNQADAHFAGWLMCPVCKKETRHYTKDTTIVLSQKRVEFGVKIAGLFRCSLNKPTTNWGKVHTYRKLASFG